ncbi:MAG: hypothetical protein ACR2F1_15270 [Nitrososphaeraceae archaeon]
MKCPTRKTRENSLKHESIIYFLLVSRITIKAKIPEPNAIHPVI